MNIEKVLNIKYKDLSYWKKKSKKFQFYLQKNGLTKKLFKSFENNKQRLEAKYNEKKKISQKKPTLVAIKTH